jgi:hypothetical protein
MMGKFASSSVLVLALVLGAVSINIAVAHDLKGIKQHFKRAQPGGGPGLAAKAQRAESFQALRDLSYAAAAPNFNPAEHFAAKGFAGSFTSVVQGIAQKTSRWPDGFQLIVCFFDGPPTAQKNVMTIYSEVLSFTTLSAVNQGKCKPNKKADIRVSFATGEGFWSVVGLEARNVKQSEPTMGLDGLGLDAPLNDDGKGVVRHEIMHSIGFEHEHQRPDVDCKFKSFEEIADIIGWKVSEVKTNFERMKASKDLLLTTFDRDSEMLYQLGPQYFSDPQSPCAISSANNKLSKTDIVTLKLLYPQVAPQMDLKSLVQN